MATTFAAFGVLTFDGVVGKVVPRTTKTVRPIENPGQVQAVERVAGAFQPSRLEFCGWFSASQADALYAMNGQQTSCHDETGTLYDVLVVAVDPRELPALSADGLTPGVWIELSAQVQAWA
jgi:hypothetical protein